MTSKDESPRIGWNDDVQNWPDSKLLKTSLSTLSEALTRSLPQRQVLEGYLRWLETHRQSPSDLSLPWEDTKFNWAQSLRTRGFELAAVLKAVEDWKSDNGPFTSSTPYPNRRYPPMAWDIGKAWPSNVHNRKARADYSGKPPGNYVCNRCGNKGHFLQACPTNMDPAFDLPPGQDYCCPICHKFGMHYSSLCPSNEDPYSIFQKRRALGVSPIDLKGREGRLLKDWEKEQDMSLNDRIRGRSRARNCEESGSTFHDSSNWRSCATVESPSSDYSPSGPTATSSKNTEGIKKRLQEVDDMKQRIEQFDEVGTDDVALFKSKLDDDRTSRTRDSVTSPDSAKTRSRRLLNEKSPSPSKARMIRKRLAEMEAAQGQGEQYKEDKSTLLAQLHEEEHGGRMSREYGVDRKKRDLDGDSDDRVAENIAPSPKRSKMELPSRHRRTTTEHAENKMEVDQKSSPVYEKPNIIKYEKFVQKLINCHPEMKVHVTEFRRRPTALDMWSDDDDRRFKNMSFSNTTTDSSIGSLDDELDHMETDEKDEDMDDIPYGSEAAKNTVGAGSPDLIDLNSPNLIELETPVSPLCS